MPISEVSAGELITALHMNEIIGTVNDLVGKVGSGTGVQVTIPTVIGHTVAQARSIILAPAAQVSLGPVLDVAGQNVDSGQSAVANRKVIVQMPSAGTKAPPNTPIALVITADAASSPTPSQAKPVIGSVDKPSVAVLQPLSITGDNFVVPSTDNIVTFDGVAATVTPGGGTKILTVTVPQGIPGAPAAGGADKPNVNLVVTAGGQTSDPFHVTIKAPISGAPTISGITPDPGLVFDPIVIAGTGFSTTLSKNVVTIADDPPRTATVTAATATQLTVTVPSNITGLAHKNDSRDAIPVRVSNTDVPNAVASRNHNFFRNREN